jgi:hypothetical protein
MSSKVLQNEANSAGIRPALTKRTQFVGAGRALIRWRAEDLARASAVELTTTRRAELTDSQISMTAANDLAGLGMSPRQQFARIDFG